MSLPNQTDVTIALLRNGTPIAAVVANYGCLKSLVVQLNSLMETFEQATGQKILTFEDMENVGKAAAARNQTLPK